MEKASLVTKTINVLYLQLQALDKEVHFMSEL